MAGEIDAALEDCNAALKLEPNSDDSPEFRGFPLAERGFANLKGKRLSAAIADYTSALAINPGDA
jgi:tetratricopeptide (TPR) repeat protein